MISEMTLWYRRDGGGVVATLAPHPTAIRQPARGRAGLRAA